MQSYSDKNTNPKFISAGSYGCVFRPNIDCLNIKTKNDDKQRKIGKVYPIAQNATIEYENYHNLINDINSENNFTTAIYGICDVKKKNIPLDNKCANIFRKYADNKDEFSQIILEDGGDDLFIYLQSNKNINFINLFKSFKSIFYALFVFSKRKIIHHDIKINNLVYNKKNDKMKLIDFGSLTNHSNIYSLKKMPLSTEYKFFPPEHHYISMFYYRFLNDNEISVNQMSDLIIPYDNWIKDFGHILKSYISKFEIEKTKIFKMFYSKQLRLYILNSKKAFLTETHRNISKNIENGLNYKSSIASSTQYLWEKIDIYMLGLTLLFVLIISMKNGIETNKENLRIKDNVIFYEKIFLLIFEMTELNPNTRININDALDIFQNDIVGN